MTIRLSATLEARLIDGEPQVVCIACSNPLGPAKSPWKPAAILNETPMKGAGGEAYTAGEQVLLRRFHCPECGALLDTETALPDDPFLNDEVEIALPGGN